MSEQMNDEDYEKYCAHLTAWAASDDRIDAEAEAARMWPEGLQLGRWDGFITTAEVERRLELQRSAYIQGREEQYVYRLVSAWELVRDE